MGRWDIYYVEKPRTNSDYNIILKPWLIAMASRHPKEYDILRKMVNDAYKIANEETIK